MNYRDAINGDIPPYLMRFIKGVGKTINTYDMIRDKEKVLLGISGGKDSLLLSLALSLRRMWLPITYDIKAILINWIEHPLAPEQKDKLYEYFDALKIDFEIVDEPMFSEGFRGEFNCYLCSRNRRRILFDRATSENIRLIALGHHLDDLVETTIINMAFRGAFDTMHPVQEFFGGKINIIRPLIETHESTVSLIAERLKVPVVKAVCPFDKQNIRSRVKPLVKEMAHIDKLAREHIYASHKFNMKVER